MAEELQCFENVTGHPIQSVEFAETMDKQDELRSLRDEFIFPIGSDGITPCIYLCGNSLGLQPKSTRLEVLNELDKWGREAVEGHFTGKCVMKLICSL